jgi:acyl-CoA thioester hydrolase
MEVARIEWLRRRGIAYAAWAEADLHLPVVDLSIRYRAPVRFDDEIDVEATLAELRVVSVRFDYRILRAHDGLLCAEGSTKLACVDGRGALRRISEDMCAELTLGERPGASP